MKLAGAVAVVAGGTRGAGRGIAVELGDGGRDRLRDRPQQPRRGPSPMARPETIEETAELVTAAGGTGIAVRVDHTDREEVARAGRAHRARSRRPPRHPRQRHLGRRPAGRMGRAVLGARPRQRSAAAAPGGRDPHHHEPASRAADGRARVRASSSRSPTAYSRATAARSSTTSRRPASSGWRVAQAAELGPHGVTAVALTPGFLRSEAMLDNFGVTEANWRDGATRATRTSPRRRRRHSSAARWPRWPPTRTSAASPGRRSLMGPRGGVRLRPTSTARGRTGDGTSPNTSRRRSPLSSPPPGR